MWKLSLVAVVLGLAAAPASAQVLDRTGKPPHVAAYGDTMVWSRLSQQDGLFHLVAKSGDQDTELPVAPLLRTFDDIDLGPGPDGSLWAVYSRCVSDERFGGNPSGCDLYRYDFADGSEAPLDGINDRAIDERFPSVWGGRIAYARGPSELVVGSLDRSGPDKRVALYAPTRHCRLGYLRRMHVDSVDLRGDRLAASADSFSCGAITYGRIGQSRRMLAVTQRYAATGPMPGQVTLDGGTVVYSVAEESPFGVGTTAFRYDPRTGRRQEAGLPAGVDGNVVPVGPALLAGLCLPAPGTLNCVVQVVADPPWRPSHPAKR